MQYEEGGWRSASADGLDAGVASEDRQERKLSRAEQLELWKQRRQGRAAKSAGEQPHTSDKARSLQGLSSSQVNQRTGRSGASKGLHVSARPRSSVPVAVSSRRESGWALGSAGKQTGNSASKALEARRPNSSSDDEGLSSRESSVERAASAGDSKLAQRLPLGDAAAGGGSCSFSASTPDQPSSAGRRFSMHVAVDEDDDEVEWRVPVSCDGATSSLVTSPAVVENADACEVPEPASVSQKAPAEEQRADLDSEDAKSDLVSVQDTELADKEDDSGGDERLESEVHQARVPGTKGSDIFRSDAECTSGVLVSTRSIRDAERQSEEAQEEEPAFGALPGTEEGALGGVMEERGPGADDGRLEAIAETWMEEEVLGCEEDVTMEEMRSKLFDTTGRLAQVCVRVCVCAGGRAGGLACMRTCVCVRACVLVTECLVQCTALLQRMVEENADLKQEVAQLQVWRGADSMSRGREGGRKSESERKRQRQRQRGRERQKETEQQLWYGVRRMVCVRVR